MNYEPLESILIVYQNSAEGRLKEYDDWYTHIHIRDAMRLEGAIATQRFAVSDDQPVIGGKRVIPGYFAHTIYEWESAAKSVAGHSTRAGTLLMEITRDGSFVGLRDYFYRPVFLSYIPRIRAMITREFRHGYQARKARSGTPSRSRVWRCRSVSCGERTGRACRRAGACDVGQAEEAQNLLGSGTLAEALLRVDG